MIEQARSRTPGPGRIVWLASYPKSGNTWLRAIVTALATHPHVFAVDQLGSGAQPHGVAASMGVYGLDSRWLSSEENERLRSALICHSDDPGNSEQPNLRKTHESFRRGEGVSEPFPVAATRAAILVVRDPRDVACSFAPFFGVDLDSAIDALGTPVTGGRRSEALARTDQPWGTWSTHTASWLASDVPFPVHLVRYEDLRRDAVATLSPVFGAIGLNCSNDQLTQAVEQVRFDRLREMEQQSGFREKSIHTSAFFRSGESGGWRTELSSDQVATIELDHHEVMHHLGYEVSTTPPVITPLPNHLGLRVRLGEVPASLDGAQHPKRWIATTQTATIVRFAPDKALMVENGNRATLQWPHDPDDLSWVLQGWAITLATLQRGEFSLHASTVEIGDRVIALAGRSGAGKSTTCMALRNRGHRLLVDDTTLLRVRDGAVFTTPYSRNVHLLPDAATALGLDFEELPRLAGGRMKASFTPDAPPLEPHRIDRIIVLEPTSERTEPALAEVRGVERVKKLGEHVARSSLAPMILGQEKYFRLITELADAVPVYVLARPTGQWSLDEVVRLIET